MMLVVKVGIGLLAAGIGITVASTGGTIAPQEQVPAPEQGIVSTLGGGNSFEIRADGRLTRVQLVNITTPTPASPGVVAECLGGEAAALLASVVPIGTKVRLTYSKDRFGRAVAAATTTDGRLVNAELARSGFAAVVTGGDGSVVPAVQEAARDAAVNKRGLHSPDVACTIPGQVKAMLGMVSRVPTVPPPGARGVDLNHAANVATDVRATADDLVWAFRQNRQDIAWRVLDPATRATLEQQTRAARDQVAAAEVALRNAASGGLNREMSLNTEQVEAARQAKIVADIRAAEARRAAQAARRIEAARQARQAAVDAARRNREDRERSSSSRRNEEFSSSRRNSEDSSSGRSR